MSESGRITGDGMMDELEKLILEEALLEPCDNKDLHWDVGNYYIEKMCPKKTLENEKKLLDKIFSLENELKDIANPSSIVGNGKKRFQTNAAC